MKKIFFCTLICCAAALSLTSCLNDENDTELTEQEKASVIATFAGDFNGNLYSAYIPTSYAETQQDTTFATISFNNDKTYTISTFPLNYLAEAISDYNNDLKEALQNYQVTEISGQFEVASASPASILFYSMSFSIMMGGASHDVLVYLNPYFSYSQFATIQGSSTNALIALFYPQYLYLDNNIVCEFSYVNTSYGNSLPLAYSFVSDD